MAPLTLCGLQELEQESPRRIVPIPLVTNLPDQLGSVKVYTKLDL